MVFQKRGRLLIGALATVLLLGTSVGAAAALDSKDSLFERIRSVYDVVEAWHKDGADAEKFTAGAIQGGLEALGDPYTNYFSDEDYEDFLESLNGTFSGIGAYLEQVDNYVVISSPIKGTPAAAAGLQSGDRVLEVNGTSMVGSTTDKAVSAIRGPEGSEVTLKIERPSEKRTFTVTIKRAHISIPEVETKMLDAEVGYLQLSSFGDDAARSFWAGIEDLKSQGAKALVLDLRQNGGGYVDAAVDIAGAFVPKGEPVMWQDGKNSHVPTNSRGRLIDMPTAVLVDGGSASASEILAGAIQDYKAGTLVGVKTFGKGTVQQILSLSIGGGMKVTVAEYLTGKQRHVDKVGLTPDYVVENPKPDLSRTEPMKLNRLLLPDDIGLDVLDLQNRLKDLGYKPETTGHLGRNTREAAAHFARDNGLSVDYAISDRFIEVLNEKVTANAKHQQQVDRQLERAAELVRAKLKH